MPTSSNWMIYGANGYTGELIARRAVELGLRPTLAGRNVTSIEALAQELKCPRAIFPLDDPRQIARELTGVNAVLHCAGPFSATAAPMMDACIEASVHYLDITGEIEVIEAAAARDGRAREAGMALMPAVGFDVVPSDCLAASLAAEIPDAVLLQLAFEAIGTFSPGTAKTMVENLPRGGRIRRDGKLTRVPTAWKTMEVPFRPGKRWCVSIPWGDVASAFYSTAIPNIEVFTAMPLGQIRMLRRLRVLMPLAGLGLIQSLLRRRVERSVVGPSPEDRAKGNSSLWGRVTDKLGNSIEGTLETPEGYTLTVETAIASVRKVIGGLAPKGFSTPSRAFGKHFILEAPGTDLKIGTRVPAAAH